MDFQSAKSFGKLRLRAFQPYHQYMSTLSTQDKDAFNANVDTRYNFLNIQWIFNPQKVLESYHTISTIHVDTVNTRQ